MSQDDRAGCTLGAVDKQFGKLSSHEHILSVASKANSLDQPGALTLMRQLDTTAWHAFRKRFTEECTPSIARATVPMLAFQKDTLVSGGSGTLVQIADRHFLITAAHVIDYATIHNIPFVLPAKDSHFQQLNNVRVYTTPVPQGRRQNDPDMREDDKVDVGVIELSSEIVARLDPTRRFVRLQEISRRRGFPEGLYMLIGYPKVHLKTVDPENKSFYTEPLRCVTERKKHDEPHDPDAHLFLHYPQAVLNRDDQLITAPEAHGMSGGGIWFLGTSEQPIELWKPEEAMLVAIDHSWHQGGGYVRGTNAAIALSLIYGHNEDLQKVFDLDISKVKLAFP